VRRVTTVVHDKSLGHFTSIKTKKKHKRDQYWSFSNGIIQEKNAICITLDIGDGDLTTMRLAGVKTADKIVW
jgi:hypothetical protein